MLNFLLETALFRTNKSRFGRVDYVPLPVILMHMKTKKPRTLALIDNEAIDQHKFIHSIIANFKGSSNELESALGMYLIGRYFGWKILHMMHSKNTINKYEAILGISIREVFPEFGLDADRSVVFDFVSQLSNFWKAVSGKSEVEDRRQIATSQ